MRQEQAPDATEIICLMSLYSELVILICFKTFSTTE